MGLIDENLLTLITFFPLVTGLGLLATSVLATMLGARGMPAPLWRGLALASTTLTFLLSLRLFATFDPVDTTFQFIAQDDWVAVMGSCGWTNKKTGKSIDSPKADFFRFENGQIVAFYEFYNTAMAFEAAS